MTINYNPKIVTDGLILNLDAANRKSYGGIGNDWIQEMYTTFGSWGGLVGSVSYYTGLNGRNGIYLNVTTAGGVNYWYSAGGQQACSPSTQYVITARVRYTNTIHPNMFYVRQFNSSGSQTSESGKFNSSNMVLQDDGWYLTWAYFTTDSTATSFYVHGYEYSVTQIWVEDIQCRLAGMADLSGQGNDHVLGGTGNLSISSKQFTLDGSTQGFIRTSALTGATKNCTVAIWYATTDGQELWAMGSNSTSWYLSASYGNNYYHSNCGSPTNYVDLATVVNPMTPTNYRNGAYHMWEAKNVDFSAWSQFHWFLYPSSWQMAGTVSKILVYNRSLSASESAQNYNAMRKQFGL